MTQLQFKTGMVHVAIPLITGVLAFLISFTVLKTQADHVAVQVDKNGDRITIVESNINSIKVGNARILTILEFQTEQIKRLVDK